MNRPWGETHPHIHIQADARMGQPAGWERIVENIFPTPRIAKPPSFETVIANDFESDCVSGLI